MKFAQLILGLVMLVCLGGMVTQMQQEAAAQQRAQDEQAARERAKHPEPWITRENGATTYSTEAYLKSQKR